MSNVTPRMKAVAKHTKAELGAQSTSIFQFWDNDRRSDVHILCADDVPQQGVRSFATIGLSEHPLMFQGEEYPVRVEFLGACGSAFPGFDNVLATLAFCVINSKWFAAPGLIFPDVLAMHRASVTMQDVYFATQFLWEQKFRSTQIDGVEVAWLLAVPISRAETEFADKYGAEKLEDLFVEKDIDIFNLNRPSVV